MDGLHNLQWYDYFRFLIAAVALTTMYISGRRAIRLYKHYPSLLQQLWWLFNFSLFISFEGALESVFFDVDYGGRTVLLFIYVVAALRFTASRDKKFKNEFHLDS